MDHKSIALPNACVWCRRAALLLRAVLARGTRALASRGRAYLQHRLPFLFRWEKVDVGSVARLYALIKLPEMPELRKLLRRRKQEAFAFERRDVRVEHVVLVRPRPRRVAVQPVEVD